MRDLFLKVGTGALGLGSSAGISMINPTIINQGVELLAQLVITLATLIALFKKKNNG